MTVVPIIIATDATQVTLFSGRKVYPVYMTIGNISKLVRRFPSQRTWLLIGYIPIPELAYITDPEEKRVKRWQLLHKCMAPLMAPLQELAITGIEMVCADGGVRRVHPILATYVGDYPEQCLVACARASRCPICTTSYHEQGDLGEDEPLRTKYQYNQAFNNDAQGYSTTQMNLGIRPVRPFWEDLPFMHASQFTTPDLLHQLHKGVFGVYIVRWCTKLLGALEMDHCH